MQDHQGHLERSLKRDLKNQRISSAPQHRTIQPSQDPIDQRQAVDG